MDLLIAEVFKLAGGRVIFACRLPETPLANKRKFEAFIKTTNLKRGIGPFVVYREHAKKVSSEPESHIAFSSSEKIDIDEKKLLAEPHFLTLQFNH